MSYLKITKINFVMLVICHWHFT